MAAAKTGGRQSIAASIAARWLTRCWLPCAAKKDGEKNPTKNQCKVWEKCILTAGKGLDSLDICIKGARSSPPPTAARVGVAAKSLAAAAR